MKDTDLMPFGKYKGTAMANVPDSYLKWLYNKLKNQIRRREFLDQKSYEVLNYIDDFGPEFLTD